MIVMWMLLACGEDAPPPPPVVRPVRTEQVVEVGGALTGSFSGTTEAGDQATLSFTTGGTIESISARVGDPVIAGQVLARLDDTSLRIQVEQASAQLAQASASANLAQQSLERVEALYLNDNASAAEVESARANYQSARAQRVSAARQRELAVEQQENAVLTANRDGTVATVLVRQRENVGSGTPVIVLTPDQELQVTVAVPASWIGRLHEGDPAQVVLTEVSAEPRPARITELGVAGQNVSYPVTVELAAVDPRIRPGMVANVTLTVSETGERRIELPLSALAEDQAGRFIWVVEPPDAEKGRTRRVDVSIGELTSHDRVVVEGVEVGARVVSAGVSLMYEGREVRLETP
ncbi:MAG: efflux RND transporter periplasmic adaptor subunit [Myxococcota bacterium]